MSLKSIDKVKKLILRANKKEFWALVKKEEVCIRDFTFERENKKDFLSDAHFSLIG